MCRRYMVEILPIMRTTLYNQSINQSINQSCALYLTICLFLGEPLLDHLQSNREVCVCMFWHILDRFIRAGGGGITKNKTLFVTLFHFSNEHFVAFFIVKRNNYFWINIKWIAFHSFIIQFKNWKTWDHFDPPKSNYKYWYLCIKQCSNRKHLYLICKR